MPHVGRPWTIKFVTLARVDKQTDARLNMISANDCHELTEGSRCVRSFARGNRQLASFIRQNHEFDPQQVIGVLVCQQRVGTCLQNQNLEQSRRPLQQMTISAKQQHHDDLTGTMLQHRDLHNIPLGSNACWPILLAHNKCLNQVTKGVVHVLCDVLEKYSLARRPLMRFTQMS